MMMNPWSLWLLVIQKMSIEELLYKGWLLLSTYKLLKTRYNPFEAIESHSYCRYYVIV